MKTLYKIFLVLSVVAFSSCGDKLTETNVNPAGVDPETVNPNLILTTVITNTIVPYQRENYNGDVSGVMQYVQKSGWSSGLNKFDWIGNHGWGGYYGNLRNINQLTYRAQTEGMEFQEGIAGILHAFNFAMIADKWGDAPYTDALKGTETDPEYQKPKFDSQETIYKGIIDELKAASTLLSKSEGEYVGIDPSADVLYHGDVTKWRKLANSLLLRYYMRLATKDPEFAKGGIQEIANDPNKYPVFTSNEDNAALDYIGTTEGDSWPAAIQFDASQSNFNRIQLCAGLRDVLYELQDPRLGTWFNKVKVQIKVGNYYPDADIVVDGIRYLNADSMAANNLVVYNKDTWVTERENGKVLVDTFEYVGMPVGASVGEGYTYNLNPSPAQGQANVHVSALADMFKDATGDLLKAKLMTYAEVCFILAEAGQKGWSIPQSAQAWYEAGVKASFDAWEVPGYDDYIANNAYDGSLEQIITQKWIADWTIAHEAWADWRRTGLPKFSWGPTVRRDNMPLRLEYDANEIGRNTDNYNEAISKLEQTKYTGTDGDDSSWSKFWLLQGTNLPYPSN